MLRPLRCLLNLCTFGDMFYIYLVVASLPLGLSTYTVCRPYARASLVNRHIRHGFDQYPTCVINGQATLLSPFTHHEVTR